MTDPDRMTKATKQSLAYRQGQKDQRELNAGRAIKPFQTDDAEIAESYRFGRRHVGGKGAS